MLSWNNVRIEKSQCFGWVYAAGYNIAQHKHNQSDNILWCNTSALNILNLNACSLLIAAKYVNHKGRSRHFTSPEELEEQRKKKLARYNDDTMIVHIDLQVDNWQFIIYNGYTYFFLAVQKSLHQRKRRRRRVVSRDHRIAMITRMHTRKRAYRV